jgi:hypothetical protein
MRYQDQVVRATQKALDDIVRAALAVPIEKLEWSPDGAARSVLNQMQEIAVSGDWFVPIVRDRQVPVFDEHAKRESIRLMRENDTLEKCIASAQAGTSALCAQIAAFPTENLEEELTMPFGGGARMTMADIMLLHQNNLVYHTGQINYVQLMLGDREMH